jgi:hypothetical protein
MTFEKDYIPFLRLLLISRNNPFHLSGELCLKLGCSWRSAAPSFRLADNLDKAEMMEE